LEKNLTPVEVVAAALIDGEGRVLMQRRRLDRAHGGLWEFPGGKLKSGESPEIGLIREIAEELGIAIAAPALAWVARAQEPAGPVVISLYTCRQWLGEPQLLDADQMAWVLPADLPELEMPPLDVTLTRELLRRI
jgi:8-oxo-dGTP diphosphatase